MKIRKIKKYALIYNRRFFWWWRSHKIYYGTGEYSEIFKPLLGIGLSDKFCFELIDDSKILPGSKYSTNRKKIQSELKKYYDSNK